MKQWPKVLIEAFWSQVDVSGGPDACWPWLGGKDPDGYGIFVFENKMYRAHRLSLATHENIMLPKPSVHAAHDCPGGDNKRCCNPKHLSWKQHTLHVQDRKAKGQSATGDKNGSRLHPECLATGDKNGARLHPEKLRRGSSVGTSKLTEKQVKKIKKLYATGDWYQAELAVMFGVSQPLIGYIVRDEFWKHVS